MSKLVLLWLDDKRDPNALCPEQDGTMSWAWVYSPICHSEIIWVKKYHEFISWIEENGLPDAICFDHDLSDININKSTYIEKTGYDAAKWLCDYCEKNRSKTPEYSIQSSNTVGKENIHKYIQNFRKHVESNFDS